ncbi:hypothetical protein V8B97DRAFT_76853 [Scleroderma yunnanense]
MLISQAQSYGHTNPDTTSDESLIVGSSLPSPTLSLPFPASPFAITLPTSFPPTESPDWPLQRLMVRNLRYEASWYGLYTGLFTHYFPVGQRFLVKPQSIMRKRNPPKYNPDLSMSSVLAQPLDGSDRGCGAGDNDSADEGASDFGDNETANNSEVNMSFTSDDASVQSRAEGGREAVLK